MLSARVQLRRYVPISVATMLLGRVEYLCLRSHHPKHAFFLTPRFHVSTSVILKLIFHLGLQCQLIFFTGRGHQEDQRHRRTEGYHQGQDRRQEVNNNLCGNDSAVSAWISTKTLPRTDQSKRLTGLIFNMSIPIVYFSRMLEQSLALRSSSTVLVAWGKDVMLCYAHRGVHAILRAGKAMG